MPSSDDVLLRVAAELAYRGSRVRSYLGGIDEGLAHEYKPIAQSVRTALDLIEDQLPSQHALFRNEKLSSEERYGAFLEYLSIYSRWFSNIHELLVYLPRQSPVPECPASLSSAFGEQYKTISPSTILGSLFNAVEYDFLDQMKSRIPELSDILPNTGRKIVLELAICDRESPAAWAVLAHELGHAIDKENALSKTVTDTIITAPNNRFYQVVLSWAGEFCADLIATEAMGVAPILSLLSLEYCFYPATFVHSASRTHPSTRWRLQVVSDYLSGKFGKDYLQEERKLYEAAWHSSLSRAFSTDQGIQDFITHDKQLFDSLITQIAEELSKQIPALNISAALQNSDSLSRCVSRLQSCIPISAQGTSREELREKLQAYRTKTHANEEARLAAFRKLKSEFLESPLNIQTILLSAHMRRSEQFQEIVANPARFDSADDVRAWCGEVADVESVVAKSIQMSTVHRLVTDAPPDSK